MKELVMQLAALCAPSGSEGGIQEALLSHVKDVADEVMVDVLGNGIARKHGTGPHIMLTAHADEAGIMVIHIEDDGFLRIISIGQVVAHTLIGRHVQFTNGVIGVINVESKVKLQDISMDNLYVDIAANDLTEAREKVRIGSSGVVHESVVELDAHRLAGRALDNRVGCAIAIESFRQAAALGREVSVVFTAQQTVGARGAKTATFRLQPDLAIVIDAAPAGDMPSAERMELKLGAGPAIKIMDGTVIVPQGIKDGLIEAAKSAGIDVQYEVWPRGMTDAGAIHLSVDGIPVGGVSYPARYVGGPSTMVDLRDAASAVKLIVEMIRRQP